jgi:hypothetical protein
VSTTAIHSRSNREENASFEPFYDLKKPSSYQDRLGTNIGTAFKKRCVFRRSDPPTTLSYHLVNGEPRIAALPSETGIIINPQTMSEEDETVPAKNAFFGAILPKKLNDLLAKTGSGQT